jgi:hypothetical protein
MRKEEVPQDAELFGHWREVAYAVDRDGNYVIAPSAGWEPANLANQQYWRKLYADVLAVMERVRAGELSPLAYHMAVHQMDVGLLAAYTGLWRWRIRRHLRPAVFARLSARVLARYAAVFNVPPAQLAVLPARPEFPYRKDVTGLGPDHPT